ncbi:MAG TPA: DNA polymerase I [Candidatus Eisenbergiella intestinigallinarum]|uniref:DNA polymerase I n=1 Tax=Candidatus Eisenbergiella intestinigallinarum TaxID=2838549 RepID=A0A9D2QM82_9FIRM|nr:DNA polymerase I [Candidatus Eisenbergiella intestinigallinarum]
MSEKLVLIDGHSILNRAFYGVPDLSNAEGLHTNAIYGFLNIMLKILEEENPGYLAVAFDVHAPTFRHELYAEYKGTRKPMPEELRQQVPVMKEVLAAMGICTVEQAGLEADDILGTLAKRGERDGMEVALVSGDRDLLQIAGEHIKIRIPKTKGGRTEIEDYYAKDVLAAWQVTPEQFVDLKALMGDSSDNIPGVPKVGPKTAQELMTRFGSLDNIYAHLDEVTKKSIKESLSANRDLAELSRTLARINTQAELSVTWDDMKLGEMFTPEAYTLFQKLEFKNMLGRFQEQPSTDEGRKENYRISGARAEAEAAFGRARQERRAAFLVLEDGNEAAGTASNRYDGSGFTALAFAAGDEEIRIFTRSEEITADYVRSSLSALAEEGVRLATFQIKFQYGYLQGMETDGLFDVLIAAYLLNPLKNDYSIADIAHEHLDLTIKEKSLLLGKSSWQEALIEKPEEFLEYAGDAVHAIWKSWPVLEEKLKQADMEKLFAEIEMPLTRVLHDMEMEGIRANPQALKDYGDALVERIGELEKSIHEKAGEAFNINSPKQLGEILFGKMKLPGGKKTKTGYSTAADVLEKLAEEHPIASEILEYRGLAKLKSTYADGLLPCIGPDGRIHTTLNQTITATGRISSTEPNLQNIPMRMELGRLIRRAFIPKEGYLFTDADYSQIELRVLAHMSGDEQLIEAYRMDADIHRITASRVFHTPFEEVTDLQRRNAKAVNFGIVYGISSFGLSQDLSISRKEASEYIEEYFKTYPGVKAFLDREVASAKEKGYSVTLFERRRPVPELKSSNFMQRSFGERVAMNAPIQGTAADIIKIAMIRVWRRLAKENLKSRLILQIHDELLIETAPGEEEEVARLLTEEMKAAASLSVTLETDLHTGTDWYEAK